MTCLIPQKVDEFKIYEHLHTLRFAEDFYTKE